ncbi:hypothetical protein GF314_11185 [bacterium]|nr:hypothetical protein [bacterium]
MIPRMLPVAFLSLALILVSGSLATPVYEGRVDLDDYGWSPDGRGGFLLEHRDGRPLGVTDRPDLPAVDLLLLVPDDLAVVDVRIEPHRVRREVAPGPLSLAGALVSSDETELPRHHLATADGRFPATWGTFGGLHTWRGYRLLAVNLHPFRAMVDEAEPTIEILEEFTVHAVIDETRRPPLPTARERLVPGERARLERALRGLVDNPTAVVGYQREDGVRLEKAGGPFLPAPLPDVSGSEVRYLIVTTDALAGEFQRLADFRTDQGLPAHVVTTEWISANYRQGADLQETIRTFLIDAYSKWGTEFLLIGGDTEVVPTRVIRSTFYPYGGHTDIPTDLYYAALDGNWSADGDGWYGEPYVNLANPGDAADMAPEMAFGRAPVRTPGGVSEFVDKVIQYETAEVGAGWANRILFAAEVLFPADYDPGDLITLDGAEYTDRLVETIGSCTSMEYMRMAETDALWPRDAPLTREALIDSLNTGHYGQVNQFGHGHFFNMSVADGNFTVSDAAALTNPNLFVLYAINCASGAFDVSCLLERFVQNPDGGAIMSIGAAREAFPSNSFGYQEIAYQYMLCEDDPRPAVALNRARIDYIANTERNTVDRWTQLNLVSLGDPAITMWSGQPLQPVVTAPASIPTGEQVVDLTVTAAGGPVVGADVCLVKDGEVYSRGVSDEAGQVSLTVIPTTAGELAMTVSGAGLAHTTSAIEVVGTETYIALAERTFDDSGANGNGLFEAGETINLGLTFTDVGGAGATGLTASLSTTHPDLTILTASVGLEDCPPGGSVTTLGPVGVKSATTVRDGAALPLRIEVTDDGGQTWVSETELEVMRPEVQVVRLELDDAPYGDGDGELEDGERFVVRPVLKNYGAGWLDQLAVQVVDAAAGVTVHGSFVLITDIAPLSESTDYNGEISVTIDDIDMASPFELFFQDNFGRTFSQTAQFRTVTPPDLPETDATIAADAIALRWNAVGEDIIGYNVYRASSADGPWVKANDDLIAGVAYFEDAGLEQLTYYWYRITAVDEHLIESEFSEVAVQTTMPSEIQNFPLPFAVQTSGHSAVGDVDGDEDLEIVLAADEIYVWNHDGSEVIDGDNNAQTTGPLTGVGGLFGPSGVALADLDGEPGLEIVASNRADEPEIVIYRADGTELPGWPRTLQDAWNWATPTVGDIDGDQDPEIIVLDTAGRLFVWHHDGTELRDGDDDPSTDGVFVDRPDSWPLSSAALYDLDGDGAAEIIYGTVNYEGDNALLAYRYDGRQATGFPFVTDGHFILCSPAVADLNRDGTSEVVFFTTNRDLYVVEADGDLYPGFPINHEAPFDDSPGPSPAVGNFDDDPDYEIVWPVNGGSYRLDLLVVDTDVAGGTSGDILPGWPVQLPANSEGSPVVGDLDGDGLSDIVQPIGSDETETPDLIAAYDSQGEVLAGFPISLPGHCRSTPVIADIEGDGDVDLIYGSWDLELHAWDLPAPYDASLVPWPMFQARPGRTGLANQFSVVSVEDELPRSFTVLPPRPNPFNPVTTVRLYVAPGSDTRLDLAVYDVRGRQVRRLHTGAAQPGWHEFTWDGRDDRGRTQASGVYFVRARQASATETFKMTLVK